MRNVGEEDNQDLFSAEEFTNYNTLQAEMDLERRLRENVGITPIISGDKEITYSPSRINNYQAIRVLASSLQGFAWLFAGIAILSILAGLAIFQESRASGNVYLMAFAFVTSLLSAFTFKFSAEVIYVLLDIEANSRQSAKTLEKILRSQ
ncbi:MAG: hypothetical protein H0T73_13830 [Ardenticatenales bacterium]|nr:hypothetical protein [Ardenticatenales bacterium]